jgi:hypothetical protein
MDEYLTFENIDRQAGSGRIHSSYRVGSAFTRRELLRKNLMYSDNIATNILMRQHGMDGYREFMQNLGTQPRFVRNNKEVGGINNVFMTARDGGIVARAIFDYIESGARYAGELRAALVANQYPFISSENYVVAGKTGWTRPLAWHDMAIVYAESPFVLVILSARGGWTDADYMEYAEITAAFERFNAYWFYPR